MEHKTYINNNIKQSYVALSAAHINIAGNASLYRRLYVVHHVTLLMTQIVGVL